MPPPTITCAICKSIVNKRATVEVEPFGRICRSHPEYQAKLAENAKKEAEARESKEQWQKAEESLSRLTEDEMQQAIAMATVLVQKKML